MPRFTTVFLIYFHLVHSSVRYLVDVFFLVFLSLIILELIAFPIFVVFASGTANIGLDIFVVVVSDWVF